VRQEQDGGHEEGHDERDAVVRTPGDVEDLHVSHDREKRERDRQRRNI